MGRIVRRKYKLGQKIDNSSFGEIFLDTHEIVAVKIVSSSLPSILHFFLFFFLNCSTLFISVIQLISRASCRFGVRSYGEKLWRNLQLLYEAKIYNSLQGGGKYIYKSSRRKYIIIF
ncbi:hypothetical protein Dimus_033512 [Dionaea muscipula]